MGFVPSPLWAGSNPEASRQVVCRFRLALLHRSAFRRRGRPARDGRNAPKCKRRKGWFFSRPFHGVFAASRDLVKVSVFSGHLGQQGGRPRMTRMARMTGGMEVLQVPICVIRVIRGCSLLRPGLGPPSPRTRNARLREILPAAGPFWYPTRTGQALPVPGRFLLS